MAKANIGTNRNNSAVGALRAVVEVVQSQKLERPLEIAIGEVGEVEEEVEEESEEESEETEGESVIEDEDEDGLRGFYCNLPAATSTLERTWGELPPSSRKRGSEELSHEDDGEDCANSDGPGHYTSPKRARRNDSDEASGSVRVETKSPPGRLKRRSEELDDDAGREEQGVKKRAKVGEESSGRSIMGASPPCKAKPSSSSPSLHAGAYVSPPRNLIDHSLVPPSVAGDGGERRTDVEPYTEVEVDAG
jgi:hypothetical protein